MLVTLNSDSLKNFDALTALQSLDIPCQARAAGLVVDIDPRSEELEIVETVADLYNLRVIETTDVSPMYPAAVLSTLSVCVRESFVRGAVSLQRPIEVKDIAVAKFTGDCDMINSAVSSVGWNYLDGFLTTVLQWDKASIRLACFAHLRDVEYGSFQAARLHTLTGIRETSEFMNDILNYSGQLDTSLNGYGSGAIQREYGGINERGNVFSGLLFRRYKGLMRHTGGNKKRMPATSQYLAACKRWVSELKAVRSEYRRAYYNTVPKWDRDLRNW